MLMLMALLHVSVPASGLLREGDRGAIDALNWLEIGTAERASGTGARLVFAQCALVVPRYRDGGWCHPAF